VSARLTERESDRRISRLVQGNRGFNGRQSLHCSNRVRTGVSPRCGRRSCGGIRDCKASPPQFVAFRSEKRTCLNSAAATFAKTPSGSEWKMPRILLSAAFCHPSHACPSCRQSRMWRLPAPGPHHDRCKSESSSRALQSPVFGSDHRAAATPALPNMHAHRRMTSKGLARHSSNRATRVRSAADLPRSAMGRQENSTAASGEFSPQRMAFGSMSTTGIEHSSAAKNSAQNQ
jgi:hypothetical protein